MGVVLDSKYGRQANESRKRIHRESLARKIPPLEMGLWDHLLRLLIENLDWRVLSIEKSWPKRRLIDTGGSEGSKVDVLLKLFGEGKEKCGVFLSQLQTVVFNEPFEETVECFEPLQARLVRGSFHPGDVMACMDDYIEVGI